MVKSVISACNGKLGYIDLDEAEANSSRIAPRANLH
jgi:hypothetical protein